MRQTEVNRDSRGISELSMLIPIKQGIIPSIGTMTYATRLKLVLNGLSALREASLTLNPVQPFTDAVDRIRFLHSVCYKVHDDSQLLLTGKFDGPWEPYLRAIWQELGALLDLIVCNCVDYPISVTASFDEYDTWVRRYRINGGFLFEHSSNTVSDSAYLRQMEQILRSEGDADTRDQKIQRLRVSTPEAEISGGREDLLRLGAQAVQSFYQLRSLYTAPLMGTTAGSDDTVLLRAARQVLRELSVSEEIHQGFTDWLNSKDATCSWMSSILTPANIDPLRWFFQSPKTPSPTSVVRKGVTPSDEPQLALQQNEQDIQGGIITSYKRAEQGCLLLLRIESPERAKTYLQSRPITCEADSRNGDCSQAVYENLAFTLQGLQRLGVPERVLKSFPEEFQLGMERRASLLGDVLENHPASWTRPQVNWPTTTGQPFSLSVVDVVVTLRSGRAKAIKKIVEVYGEQTDAFRIMHVQPLFSKTVGAFGYRDGISQPKVDTPFATADGNQVPLGELVLGHAGHRDSASSNGSPCEWHKNVLKNGSFLVVRKLQQNTELFNEFLDEARKIDQTNMGCHRAPRSAREDVMAKLMGRTPGGDPLIESSSCEDSNQFTYESDPHGEKCPIHAHIRRANPRTQDENNPVPKIMRRGMSYEERSDDGSTIEQGLMFMAYNRSIANQFEVIQRWMIGGNSSGGYSGQSDAFVGVPARGEARVFPCVWHDGSIKRFHLDKVHEDGTIQRRLFTQLQWGLYLFAPSINWIKKGFSA